MDTLSKRVMLMKKLKLPPPEVNLRNVIGRGYYEAVLAALALRKVIVLTQR